MCQVSTSRGCTVSYISVLRRRKHSDGDSPNTSILNSLDSFADVFQAVHFMIRRLMFNLINCFGYLFICSVFAVNETDCFSYSFFS